MLSQGQCAAVLLATSIVASAFNASVRFAEDPPPPVPYGTQETLKLHAIVDAAPFMAASDDRVVTLKQERLRVCVQALAAKFEAFKVGRERPFTGLAEPLAQVKASWIALCTNEEQKMPMLQYALQIAEQRERISQVLYDQGQLEAVEILAAKRDRCSAEIEMIECQRAASNR